MFLDFSVCDFLGISLTHSHFLQTKFKLYFPQHYQGCTDLNTVNTNCPLGKYFLNNNKTNQQTNKQKTIQGKETVPAGPASSRCSTLEKNHNQQLPAAIFMSSCTPIALSDQINQNMSLFWSSTGRLLLAPKELYT